MSDEDKFDEAQRDNNDLGATLKVSLEYQSEILMFWTLTVMVPVILVASFFYTAKDIMISLGTSFTLMVVFSCILNNGFKPLAIFTDLWTMWKSGFEHVRRRKI